LGAGEAGVLAHRPEPVAVHAGMDAPGERVFARLAEALLQAGLDVLLLVEALDLDPGIGDHPALALILREHRGDVAMELLVDRGPVRVLGRTVLCALTPLAGCLVLWPGGHRARIDMCPRDRGSGGASWARAARQRGRAPPGPVPRRAPPGPVPPRAPA